MADTPVRHKCHALFNSLFRPRDINLLFDNIANRRLRRGPAFQKNIACIVPFRENTDELPLFALANAGVAMTGSIFAGRPRLIAGVFVGLTIGKPLGIILASALAVRLKVAVKPAEYSWAQLAGAGALAGIGFTMSLFIAGQAFAVEADFEAAKIAILAASVLSAAIGVTALSFAGGRTTE